MTPASRELSPNTLLRLEVEDFLYAEADLLDSWDLNAWFALFDDPCEYSIPPTDVPDADPERHTFLVHDDRFLLGQRVSSLLTKTAHAEWPHSRTRHLVSNVRVSDAGDRINVSAGFAVFRMRYDLVDTYVGIYRHELIRTAEGSLRFRRRTAILDLESLVPQAKVSIIL
jgi:p-cumate 2,3-dioxygenase beta subunit